MMIWDHKEPDPFVIRLERDPPKLAEDIAFFRSLNEPGPTGHPKKHRAAARAGRKANRERRR